MTALSRIVTETTAFAITSGFIGVWGYLGGYAYARFSQLPAPQVALCWAIYAVASNAFSTLACCFIKNGKARSFIRALVVAATGTLFIQEMRNRRLMGDYMAIFMAAVHALCIAGLLYQTLPSKK